VDRLVAELAAAQHGVVALWQLSRFGLTMRIAERRVATGRWHRVHQGVYAIGHPSLTDYGELMAAVLACGSEAVLSHVSAAELWGLTNGHRDRVDVTAPGRRGRIPGGINAHRHNSLVDEDRAVVNGIPCTSVARTLLDVAGTTQIWELRRLIEKAEVKRLLDHGAVRRLIRRSRGRRGVARLRMVLDDLHPKTKRTRSPLERRFLRMCSRALLPPPEVNVLLDLDGLCIEADFLWRDARLVVETDGRQTHDTATAFEADRRRDQRLTLAGWRVIRCTWSQVINEPADLVRTLKVLLAKTAADGPKTPLYGGK
jgi:very-short-patch-repair endonuclease